MVKDETPEEVRRWFLKAFQKLWPAAAGSISLRKSPCIRRNCQACASGTGHSSYAWSGYRGNHRFSVYVPDDLAPEVQKAVANGRQLQELIKEAGIRYVQARKKQTRLKARK
jgi:molybdopterin-guanine dinucleotide biosynthesis protein A